MKKIALILFAVIIATAFCLAAPLDVDVEKLLTNRPTKTAYPDDETVIMYEGVHYTLEDDGRIIKEVHRLRTMFTENSLDRYGDPVMHFNEAHQKMDIKRARGYLIDGTAVDTYVDETGYCNAHNQLTPRLLGKTPDYTDFQEMIVNYVGLEWHETSEFGGVSELWYTITDTDPWRPWLEGTEYFQGGEPVQLKMVYITIPEGVELKFKPMNGVEYEGHDKEEGRVTYRFRIENAPAIMHDDAYSFRYRFVPTLIFSTCESWSAISKHFAAEIDKSVEFDDYLKKSADKVVKDIHSPSCMVKNLHKMARERVNSVNYRDADFRWHHRNAAEVLKSAYGNSFDQTILLSSLLLSQGIPSRIAVSAANFNDEFIVPTLAEFNRFWVEVKNHGETVYLDPAAKQSSRCLKDIPGYALFLLDGKSDKPEILPAADHHNAVEFKLMVKVADDGSYTGKGCLTAGGFFSPYYDAVEHDKGSEEWIKSEMSGILPNVEITSGTVKRLEPGMCKFGFEFKGEKLGDTENGYIILSDKPKSPILLREIYPSRLHLYLTEHANPVFFKTNGARTEDITFELPDSWTVETAPDEFLKESSVGSGSIQIKIEDGKLNIYKSVSIKESVVEPDKYPLLHNLYNIWHRNSSNTIVFKVE